MIPVIGSNAVIKLDLYPNGSSVNPAILVSTVWADKALYIFSLTKQWLSPITCICMSFAFPSLYATDAWGFWYVVMLENAISPLAVNLITPESVVVLLSAKICFPSANK